MKYILIGFQSHCLLFIFWAKLELKQNLKQGPLRCVINMCALFRCPNVIEFWLNFVKFRATISAWFLKDCTVKQTESITNSNTKEKRKTKIERNPLHKAYNSIIDWYRYALKSYQVIIVSRWWKYYYMESLCNRETTCLSRLSEPLKAMIAIVNIQVACLSKLWKMSSKISTPTQVCSHNTGL